jgi:hypothetical protein
VVHGVGQVEAVHSHKTADQNRRVSDSAYLTASEVDVWLRTLAPRLLARRYSSGKAQKRGVQSIGE